MTKESKEKDDRDWEHIKKQIKKTLENHPSTKQNPSQTHPPEWSTIEKKLRKNHHHNKPPTKSTPKPPKQSSSNPTNPTSDQPKETTAKTPKDPPKTHSLTKKIKKHIPSIKITTNPKKNPKPKKQSSPNPATPFHPKKPRSQLKKHFKKTKKTLQTTLSNTRSKIHTPLHHLANQHPKDLIINNIVELSLITLGIILLSTLTQANIKIGFTLLLIASYLLILMSEDTEKKTKTTIPLNHIPKKQSHKPIPKQFKKTQKTTPLTSSKITISSLKKLLPNRNTLKTINLTLNDRITIVLISWTLLLYLITADIEIYFVLIFLGILITKEMTDIYTTNTFKHRLNAYIIIFLFIYIILISQKIITILQT